MFQEIDMKDVDKETWFLNPGAEVVAIKILDELAANVQIGTLGVVFQESDGVHGPLVRWETGTVCNVYPGDVDKLPTNIGKRPILRDFIRVFVEGDPDLAQSDCTCCAKKREMLAKLKEANLLT
jgi:hypothetical protein